MLYSFEMPIIQPKPLKYLGLSDNSWETEKQLYQLAEHSIYRWWWDFLHLIPEFWFAQQTGYPIKHEKLKETYELVGGYPTKNFESWWKKRGCYLFTEHESDEKVHVLNDSKTLQKTYQSSIVLELPLSLTKKTLQLQIKDLLDEYHRGRYFYSEQYSNAQLKLANHKFDFVAIQKQYRVFLYRTLIPKAPLWVIGDRLRISPHQLEIRKLDRRTIENKKVAKFLNLQTTTWRMHSKAESLRNFVKFGSFPNYEKIESDENYFPFGIEHHQEFLTATSEKSDSNSPWLKWLRRHFYKELIDHIHTINGLGKIYGDSPQFQKNFTRYLNGEIEL
jgi:hypothetical protein